MRYIARALALIWAGVWTFNVAATTWLIESGPLWTRTFTVGSWLTIAGLVLIPWVSAAVAWRWGIGGVVLALVGVLTSMRGWDMLFTAVHFRDYGDMVDAMVFLPCLGLSYVAPLVALLAGALFLASWWRSSISPVGLRVIEIVLAGLGGLTVLVLSASVEGRWTQAELQRANATATAEVYATATAVEELSATLVARSEDKELVGYLAYIGGDASDVFVQGVYAYVAGGGRSGFRVVDISDPAAPVEVGSYDTPGMADGVYVFGSHAYVAAGSSGLRVLDVSNPTAPVEAGSYATPDYAHRVYVSGSYAYVAAHTSGLRVVDVSNPASPYEVGFCDTPGWAFDVYVSDGYAYVADFDGGLRVIDVSNPASPFEVGSYATPGFASGVFVSGSYAYVAANHLLVIDVSNPASPHEVGSYSRGGGDGVYVSGSYAYVAAGSSGLLVVDISDLAAPVEVGSYDTLGYAENVYVSGPYAYVVDGRVGLFILRMVRD